MLWTSLTRCQNSRTTCTVREPVGLEGDSARTSAGAAIRLATSTRRRLKPRMGHPRGGESQEAAQGKHTAEIGERGGRGSEGQASRIAHQHLDAVVPGLLD